MFAGLIIQSVIKITKVWFMQHSPLFIDTDVISRASSKLIWLYFFKEFMQAWILKD